MSLPEGVTPKYGIFTTDRDFADYQIDEYIRYSESKLSKRIRSANGNYALMEDGTKYEWIKPNDYARGYKCSFGVIDLATCNLEFIREWIPFICIFADKKDYVFVDSQNIVDGIYNKKPYDLHTLIDRLQKIESILGRVKKVSFNDSEFFEQQITSIEVVDNEIVLSNPYGR